MKILHVIDNGQFIYKFSLKKKVANETPGYTSKMKDYSRESESENEREKFILHLRRCLTRTINVSRIARKGIKILNLLSHLISL